MLQVSKLLPQGHGLAPSSSNAPPPSNSTGTCARKAASTPPIRKGRQLGVFLPRGTLVRGGDVLVAEDGSMVKRDRRAAGRCCVITHCSEHGSLST
jgi:urease accessory protein